jgi:hypothetical protein
MSTVNTGYTLVNLHNDAWQFYDSLKTALTSTNGAEVQAAWNRETRETRRNKGQVSHFAFMTVCSG